MTFDRNRICSERNYLWLHHPTFKWSATCVSKILPIFYLRCDLRPNPYCILEKLDGMPMLNYKCLIDITSDTSLKQQFLQLSKHAVLKLLLFSTTYLQKAGFSRYVGIKFKNLYRLDVALNMRIQSTIIPYFKGLYEAKK